MNVRHQLDQIFQRGTRVAVTKEYYERILECLYVVDTVKEMEKTNHTDEQLIENIAKCIGRAVAPYASKCGEYFSDDKKYAKNVPYTDIKTEAKTIARMFQKLNEEHTKDEKQSGCCEKCEALKKENGQVCCRWCCTATHNHIECSDSSRCHCPCHQPTNTTEISNKVVDNHSDVRGIEELKKHCWVDRNGDHQMPVDEVHSILQHLQEQHEAEKRELVEALVEEAIVFYNPSGQPVEKGVPLKTVKPIATKHGINLE